MKKILSLIIVIAMLASMLPSVLAETPIPDEELREIAAATYTFTKGGRSDEGMENWFERAILDFETDGETTTAVVRKTEKNPAFTSFPEASTNPNEQWAYVGATNGMSSSGTKSTSNGTELPIVEPGSIYLSAATVPGDGWIAFKIKVPATANYEITGLSAYVSKNTTSEMKMYIVPKSEALDTVLANPATYGDFSTIFSSKKYYVMRENAASFADLGISSDYLMGTANLMGDANTVQDLATVEGKVTDKKLLFLETDTEYFLFLHNANSKARSMPISSITLSEPVPEFDRISVKFNNTVVGSKLSPSVIWIAGNKKLDGKDGVVNFEIKENSEGALLVGRDGNIYARAPGKAILTVSGTLDGITKTVDVEIEVFEDNSYAGANQSYLFYKDAYQESGLEVVVPDSKLGDYLSKEVFMTSTAIDYGTNGRPWALVSAAASKPTNSGTYFNQTSSYLDLSGSMNDWVAFKVKVPAPGKYSIDLSGYNYKNNGLAMLYMTPYSSDMNFDSVRENIDSYMSDENFVGEADLNGSLNTVVSYTDVGTFVADKNLNWSAGYAEYLMVVKSASSEISPGKSSVLLYDMKLCGSAGIGTLKNKFDFDTIGIGESASLISTTAKNAVGSDFDLSNAYIEYSVAEEDREILELCDDGISFRGLCEGKATVKTLVLTPGQVFVGEDEITVADREGILAVYLYSADVAEVGETLDFVTRLELNNRRVVSGGEIQGLTIVSESEPGVLKISDDGKHVIAKKAGAAEVKATVKARGNIYTTASTTIAVSELDAKYPSCFKIDLSRNAYTGDTETQLSELTDYTLARNWAFYKFSGASSEEPTIELAETQYTTVAWTGVSDTNYLAFKTIFPKAGSYTVKTTGFSNDRSAKLDLFVIPATEDNITNLDSILDVNGEYYFGSADTYRETEEAGTTNAFGTKTVPSAGEYIVVFRTASGLAKENNSTYGDKWYPHYIDFINENSLQRAEISSQDNRTEIEPGEKIQLTPVLYGPNDTPLEYDGTAEVIWKTSDANIATVDEDGMLCGANEGEVTVIATIIKDGETAVAELTVRVADTSGFDTEKKAKVVCNGYLYAYATTKLEVQVPMNSGRWVTVPTDFLTFNVISGGEYATVDADGTVTGLKEGTIVIQPEISSGWKDGAELLTIEPVSVEIAWDATLEPQIYTIEERENAKRNATRYSWAKQGVKSAINEADRYLENFDKIYASIIPEGLPRFYLVGHYYDPRGSYCNYCGCNVGSEYGVYKWNVDALQREWKIQCPDCKRLFPSNDFGSFYKLGLSDNKTSWSFDKALQKHHEMFVCEDGENCTHEALDIALRGSEEWYTFYGYGVEGGYLTNDLYGERNDPRWGVDDSRGYLAKYDPNDIAHDPSYVKGEYGLAKYMRGGAPQPVRDGYISYYLNQAVWYGNGNPANGRLVRNALESLKNAFLYTGDPKYGRAGAILLDRVADVYPAFDWYQWADYRGNSFRGKISDPVGEVDLAIAFSEAYDAFKPIYNDPYVVEYLSKHGAIYEEDENGNYKRDENGDLIPINLKDSPGALIKNVEDNILRESYRAARRGEICGNFGSHQGAIAAVAVALNKMPDTAEMIEWLMSYGKAYNTGEYRGDITGGNVMMKLIEDVSRDGIGNENAPGYNTGWVQNLLKMVLYLADYEEYPSANFFDNPKFAKMFLAHIRLVLGGYYTAQIGDSGGVASIGITLPFPQSVTGFEYMGDRKLAQASYLANDNSTDGIQGSIFNDDPEQVAKDIEKIIEEDGELVFESDMLTGFGFAVLRAGANNKSVSAATNTNTTRDFAIYYGANAGHGHNGLLNLYMDAFGLNLAPDLGYPEQTGSQPNRLQWVGAPISHNTVVVDESRPKTCTTPGTPYHFDDSGRVKVMDVDVNGSTYKQTDEYRRSVVMVEVDDEISYGVDFFHVKGGNDHLYSFHSQSDELTAVSGLDDLKVTPMYTDEEGNLYGVYAGADVKYGPDPGGAETEIYPVGYTWLKNIRTYNSIDDNFTVEWNVKDWRKVMTQNRDVRLRLTMVSDEPMNEVTFATALPQQVPTNKPIGNLDYLLVRREGKDLDTTFTSVLEPYEYGKAYIEKIEKVSMERAPGEKPGFNDAYSAVKVTLKNGRIDYVIYSNNTEVDYIVDNKLAFRGFAGVLSLQGAEDTEHIVYKYLNDGETLEFIGESAKTYFQAYTGEVKSFTHGLEMENFITYTPTKGQDVDVDALAGKFVYVDNDKVQNGSYLIESATKNEDGDIVLALGMVSLVRSYIDEREMDLGYVYNIKEGQSLCIPLSVVESSEPNIDEIEDQTVSAGSSITIPIAAHSPVGKDITLIGTTLPRGMTLNAEQMTVTWKPDDSQVGDNHVAITADDGTLSTTLHFMVTVYGATTGASKKEENEGSGDSESATGGGGGGGGDTAATEDTNDTDETDDAENGENSPDASGETEYLRFTDLGNHAWAAESINSLADDGIIKGTTASTFSPANNITRADFALLLVRAFALESDNTENFADVSSSDYFAPELAVARNTGIVNGIGENKFAPRNTITRQDMMVIVYRALNSLEKIEKRNDTQVVPYDDFDLVAPYAQDAVSALISAGFVNGKSGLIAPTDYTTRAEVAVLLKRILEYTK